MSPTTDNKAPAAAAPAGDSNKAASEAAKAAEHANNAAQAAAGGDGTANPSTANAANPAGPTGGSLPEGITGNGGRNRSGGIGPGGGDGPREPIMEPDEAEDDPLAIYTVLIVRDASNTLPKHVMGYEIPVLLEVYGEDRIVVVEKFDTPDKSEFDVGKAFDALVNSYKGFDDQRRHVYPSARELAKVCGVRAPSTTAGEREQKAQSKVRKVAKKTAAK